MAKKQKSPLKPVPPLPPLGKQVTTDYFERLENRLQGGKAQPPTAPPSSTAATFTSRHYGLHLFLPLILGTLFAVFLFDTKISEGGDDSMYIEAAHRYAQDYFGYFYWSNAPLYPMLLGALTLVTGLNLVVFKVLNTFLFLLHLVLMYVALHRRFPALVALPVLLISAVNSYLVYFASQTYTEMLFLVMQAWFLIVFFRFIEAAPKEGGPTRRTWFTLAGVVGLLLLLTLTKNIAIGMVGAVGVFLAMQGRVKLAAMAVGGYVLARVAWQGLVTVVWGGGNQYGSQGAILLQKDPYDPTKGTEELAGFVTRFFKNLDLYTSKRLLQILGFREEYATGTYGIITLAIMLVTLFAGWMIWRETGVWRRSLREPHLSHEPLPLLHQPEGGNVAVTRVAPREGHPAGLLLFLYLIFQLSLIFVVLQVIWDQARLILVYVPLWLLVMWYGAYLWLRRFRGGWALAVYLAITLAPLGSSLWYSTKKAIAHFPVLKKNLQGDKYYGYTPDWENYLRLSEWCADSLPPQSLVACRKAPMSFVYGKGREFFPVYTAIAINPATNLSYPDSVLQYFHDNGVTHVLMGSLRQNPTIPEGQIINTLHRMMQPVMTSYPGKVKFVKKMGEKEPAYLYEILK